jgi:transposase
MNEKPVHLRFIGSSVYCIAAGRHVKLPDDLRYGDTYTCPACGHQEPAKKRTVDFRLKCL